MVKIFKTFQVPAVIRVNGVLELDDVLPEEINNNIIIFSHQTFAENIMQCYDIIGQAW